MRQKQSSCSGERSGKRRGHRCSNVGNVVYLGKGLCGLLLEAPGLVCGAHGGRRLAEVNTTCEDQIQRPELKWVSILIPI